MPKGIMIAYTNPRAGVPDDEFARWYETQHMPGVLARSGFVRAVRLELFEHPQARSQPYRFITVYEVEADELAAAVERLLRPDPAPHASGPSLLSTDPPPVFELYREVAAVDR